MKNKIIAYFLCAFALIVAVQSIKSEELFNQLEQLENFGAVLGYAAYVDQNNRPYDAKNIILNPTECAKNEWGGFILQTGEMVPTKKYEFASSYDQFGALRGVNGEFLDQNFCPKNANGQFVNDQLFPVPQKQVQLGFAVYVDQNNRPYDANNINLDPNACARNANGQFLQQNLQQAILRQYVFASSVDQNNRPRGPTGQLLDANRCPRNAKSQFINDELQAVPQVEFVYAAFIDQTGRPFNSNNQLLTPAQCEKNLQGKFIQQNGAQVPQKDLQFADHLDAYGQPCDLDDKPLDPALTPKNGQDQFITENYTPARMLGDGAGVIFLLICICFCFCAYCCRKRRRQTTLANNYKRNDFSRGDQLVQLGPVFGKPDLFSQAAYVDQAGKPFNLNNQLLNSAQCLKNQYGYFILQSGALIPQKAVQFAHHLDKNGQPCDFSKKLLDPALTPKNGQDQFITANYTPAQKSEDEAGPCAKACEDCCTEILGSILCGR